MSSSNDRRGLFVSVDGPSRAGKSTIVEHLAQLLVANGEDVHVTAEPSSRLTASARRLPRSRRRAGSSGCPSGFVLRQLMLWPFCKAPTLTPTHGRHSAPSAQPTAPRRSRSRTTAVTSTRQLWELTPSGPYAPAWPADDDRAHGGERRGSPPFGRAAGLRRPRTGRRRPRRRSRTRPP